MDSWLKILGVVALIIAPTLALLGFVGYRVKKSDVPKKEEHRDSD